MADPVEFMKRGPMAGPDDDAADGPLVGADTEAEANEEGSYDCTCPECGAEFSVQIEPEEHEAAESDAEEAAEDDSDDGGSDRIAFSMGRA